MVTSKAVQEIMNQTNLTESQVVQVLYIYFAEVMKECLTSPYQQANTMFGTIYLDDNNELKLDAGKQMAQGGVFQHSDLIHLIYLLKDGPNVPLIP